VSRSERSREERAARCAARADPRVREAPQAPEAQGPHGPAGAAGAYRFIDQAGRDVGPAVGFFSGIYPQILLPNGLLLVFDNDASSNGAYIPGAAGLYYGQPGCAGPPYTFAVFNLPIQIALFADSPAVAGSTIYQQVAGTRTRINAQSTRLNGSCRAFGPSVIDGYQVRDSGSTVPTVQKPLTLVPG
jgi:hypothetical protein